MIMENRNKFLEYLLKNEGCTIHFMNDFLKKILSKIFHTTEQSLPEFLEICDKIDGLVDKHFIFSRTYLSDYERKSNENNKL